MKFSKAHAHVVEANVSIPSAHFSVDQVLSNDCKVNATAEDNISIERRERRWRIALKLQQTIVHEHLFCIDSGTSSARPALAVRPCGAGRREARRGAALPGAAAERFPGNRPGERNRVTPPRDGRLRRPPPPLQARRRPSSVRLGPVLPPLGSSAGLARSPPRTDSESLLH